MNDVVLKAEESGFAKRQFKIMYSVLDDKYYVKDLGDNRGTFVRLDKKTFVHQGNVFTFATYHIAVSYKMKQERDPEKRITLQIYDGNQQKEQ